MKAFETKFDPMQILGPADQQSQPYASAPIAFGSSRSHGKGVVHLSQIYRDLANSVAPRDNDLTEADLNWYASLGFIWEQVLARGMADGLLMPNCVRPGEIELDGITGSPDLVDLHDFIVVDAKVKWKSMKKLGESPSELLPCLKAHFWPELVQLQGYCHMLNAGDNEDAHAYRYGQLLIMFVNGDWRPPVPCARMVNLEFTAAELQQNWLMITNHGKRKGWLK